MHSKEDHVSRKSELKGPAHAPTPPSTLVRGGSPVDVLSMRVGISANVLW